jgi:hypothetical protein
LRLQRLQCRIAIDRKGGVEYRKQELIGAASYKLKNLGDKFGTMCEDQAGLRRESKETIKCAYMLVGKQIMTNSQFSHEADSSRNAGNTTEV